MALLDFQIALGRSVRMGESKNAFRGLQLTPAERDQLVALSATKGFRFTVDVQRSWCCGRAAKSAQLTLSTLSTEQCSELLLKWVNSGGGTASFYRVEAEGFLTFISKHLPNPSHELTICQFEQVTQRITSSVSDFVLTDFSGHLTPASRLQRGRLAGLVWFYAEPNDLLDRVQNHQPLPPLSAKGIPLIFGAGIDGLCRRADRNETNLWKRLEKYETVAVLLREGCQIKAIEYLLLAGVLESVDNLPTNQAELKKSENNIYT